MIASPSLPPLLLEPLEAPPPPFIPPPEVQIQQPPPQQPTITVQQTTPPPQEFRPTPPVAAAPAPATTAPVSASVVCSNYATVMGDVAYPREALRQGLDRGEAVIQFTLTANGEVRDIKAIRATHPIFARNSIRIVGEYKCQGQGRDVTVQVPFGYKLD